ncbi:hypothetical protein ACWKSP_09845 [Micromonosporaceae bacterium Da 78-11]
MRDAGPETDDGSLLTSATTVVRLIVGWAGTAIGVLNLGMGIDTGPGTTDGPYLLFHLLLVIDGVLLLGLDRVLRDNRPGLLAVLAGAGLTLLGLLVSALPGNTFVCCMRGASERHGFPFALLGRDAGSWQFSLGHAIADLLFWACAGLIVAVLVTLVRPARKAPTGQRSPGHRTHAEDRATPRERAVEDENVGGLP